MNHFDYRDGEFSAEDVPLSRIAETVGTPFYCYSTATLERHYRVFSEAFADVPARVCYALKANANLAVIRTLGALGAGADVVSEGEIRCALAAAIPPERIVFAGVGKTREEMAFALEQGVYQFNVESEPELEALAEIAAARGLAAPVAIRVNPDVDARTHAKISTGKAENKFGVPMDRAREIYGRAARLAGIETVGLAIHIGSQITDLRPFESAYRRLADLVRAVRADGHEVARLDLGGGLGIPYFQTEGAPPLPVEYAEMVKGVTRHLGCELTLEPGRMLVGNAGVLVARVIYVKPGAARTFVIMDAAMNDLLRPSLYEAYHHIEPVRQAPPDAPLSPVDFVGPVCETGDTLAEQRPMPPLAAGDLVAVCTAGAYGAVMASTYNARPLAPEVMVKGGAFAVVKPRQGYEAVIDRNVLPPWLGGPQAVPDRGAA